MIRGNEPGGECGMGQSFSHQSFACISSAESRAVSGDLGCQFSHRTCQPRVRFVSQLLTQALQGRSRISAPVIGMSCKPSAQEASDAERRGECEGASYYDPRGGSESRATADPRANPSGEGECAED